MGKEHLDFLPFATRLPIFRCLHDGAGDIACILIDAASNLARWSIGTASRLQSAVFAIGLPLPTHVASDRTVGQFGHYFIWNK